MIKLIRLVTLAAISCSFIYAPPALDTPALMPWPKEITLGLVPGEVPVTGDFTVSTSGPGAADSRVQNAIPRFIARLARQTGIPIPNSTAPSPDAATLAIIVEAKDHPAPQHLGDNERYSLTVADSHLKLSADSPLGVLRGLETILQLVRETRSASPDSAAPSAFSIPNVIIQDEPRFAWRGLSFDVSRHFMPVPVVKRTIDGIAAVKLNVLHWHLSDDEGFRVESKVFPLLQQKGSDGMFYTQAEIRDVIAYAADRGIRVVPEFDVPGHSTSWLAAYPLLAAGDGPFRVIHDHREEPTSVMDPTVEYTYTFLDSFIGEMAHLFPDEYLHIGGDEVSPKKWNASPHIVAFMRAHHMANAAALQTYFSKRLLAIVAKHGKHAIGWDEILNPDLPKSAVIQSWRGQQSLWSAARDGYQGILSAGYYLDLSYPSSYHYAIDPMKAPASPSGGPVGKDGLAPGSPAGLTPEQQKLILGGEAATWEELADSEIIDARLWPRLAAIAERFWSPESVTDVASMYARLKVTNHWLEWLGLTQRSNLVLARRRLAGSLPQQPLDELASLLEPVKGYSRHAERYGIFTPLNRLPFAIPAESNIAREFRDAVDEFLAAPKEQRNAAVLQAQLTGWLETVKNVRPILSSQSLLTENVPVADAVEKLCVAGQQALTYLADPATAPPGWKQKTSATVDQFVNKRIGDLLIQIAPGIQKLVASVPAPTPQ